MTSPSLAWLHQTDVDDSTQQQLQLLFGQGNEPVDVPKILTVQRKLQAEAEHRSTEAVKELTTNCDKTQGQVFFMVNMPDLCQEDAPCLQNGQCHAESDLLPHATCTRHTAADSGNLGMTDLNLFGQCRKGTATIETRQFTAAEAADPEAADPEAADPEAADPEAADPEDERHPHRRHPHHALQCPVCAPGTEGSCLNTQTGKCSLFNEFGICPEATAPCQPNPCPNVERPCFHPLSPPSHPQCVAKLPDTCRLVDASQSVCLSHACPLGTIENTGTSWQLPFYSDPINYAAGLTAQHLAGSPTQDRQVRLPAGGASVIAVEDEAPGYVGERLAAGSAWRQREFPQWESSFVLP